MTDERPWEEYPDLSFHERIFNAQFLLNQAYPETQQADVHKIEATLCSLNQPAETYLQQCNQEAAGHGIPEALIVRCLANALPDTAILIRLFEAQINGEVPFTEAENILWHVYAEQLPAEGDRRQRFQLTLYCPTRWTGPLEADAVVECEPFVRDLEA